MDELRYLALTVILAPLLSAGVIGLLNKRLPRDLTHWLACSLLACSFIASLYILIGFLTDRFTSWDQNIYVWGQTSTLMIPVGFLIDKLTAMVITVVTFVSFAVHIYSIGYMREDPGYQRFFSYISLFTFFMLMLVMSNNFAQLFFGWEGVGLVSYLLIGFWYERESANFAGLKAFIVNRVGDLGFVIGIAAIFMYCNSLQYADVFKQIPLLNSQGTTIVISSAVEWSVITFICICLFVGAMAKSAQVPLHVWLPDSMEGPTPISALIHAATMVTAGVFMVARMSPIFEYSDVALICVTVIGALTCFFMGILAVVQSDIKRIIAYSTLSQLGYMVLALGVSAYAAGIFHLVTHAFYKALLFLGAGSVILAMHHEQNIFKMGGLRKYLPVTFGCMIIGNLALMGFPGFAGFYSKDLIIAASKISILPFASCAYYLSLFSVFITALYSVRLMLLVFRTSERMDEKTKSHLHEQPAVILVPLIILAIPSVIIGAALINAILNNFFGNAIFVLPQHDVLGQFTLHEFDGAVKMFLHGFISLEFLFLLAGALTAWLCYERYPQIPKILQQRMSILSKVLYAKYGFDAFNEKILARGTRWLGKYLWQKGDVNIIDGHCVNGSAQGVARIAYGLRAMQAGYLYHYVFVIVTGLLALIFWIVYI